jgi:AIR synthase-related protein
MSETLEDIMSFLGASEAIEDKTTIRRAYSPALDVTFSSARLGDDCAAIADESGSYLLFAAEGLLPSFVEADPWFAGYCAVMVNISDICAMGGRPIGVVNIIWTPDYEASDEIWSGMKAAANDYGVPIVGGHTTLSRKAEPVYLAAAIVGKANSLLTSFAATPGDVLLVAVDLDGSYREDKPFWNCSVGADPDRLRSLIALLPQIAENGWCRAAKDISNGGIIGTLIMLLESSEVGARLDLSALPRPEGVDLNKWLISFPSYGYVLSVDPRFSQFVIDLFADNRIRCNQVGEISDDRQLQLHLGPDAEVFWRDGHVGEAHA